MGSCGRLGESPNTWKHFGPKPTQAQYSVISVLVRQETVLVSFVFQLNTQHTHLGRLDLGAGFWGQDYGWGLQVSRPFGAAEGVLYGTELGSVTSKRVGLFVFPIQHSTHSVCVFITAGPFTKLCAWGRRRVEDIAPPHPSRSALVKFFRLQQQTLLWRGV